MNYRKMSQAALASVYWGLEIEISNLASKYKRSEEYIIQNSCEMSVEDKRRLGVLLWEVVSCLKWYNAKKKKKKNQSGANAIDNVIAFPGNKYPMRVGRPDDESRDTEAAE